MTKKEIQYCKEVYERMLAGAYEPSSLTAAYVLISGDDTIQQLQVKKRTVYNYFQYHYVEDNAVDSTLTGEKDIDTSTHTHTEEAEIDNQLEIKLEKPANKKKKRVYKKKK
jgi:hypothetical protein